MSYVCELIIKFIIQKLTLCIILLKRFETIHPRSSFTLIYGFMLIRVNTLDALTGRRVCLQGI